MVDLPRVTFGVINCNRLHYLKSCVESLIFCTDDYHDRELIIVDNASVEKGTQEYLKEKENQGFKVFRQKQRDPNNEFAQALNLIAEEATGDLIAPLQGDIQFVVRGGWLQKYAEFYSQYGSAIGCVLFDAQRDERLVNDCPYGLFEKEHADEEFRMYVCAKRPPLQGAADCMYSREIIDKIYPWQVKNQSHEGGSDSETAMLNKIKDLTQSGILPDQLFSLMPQIPVAAGIFTDSRGTNARVRGNKRYGDYWPPKENFRYYQIHEYQNIVEKRNARGGIPLSIEMMAIPVGWKAPLDPRGRWLKNPIKPEHATPDDYVVLDSELELEQKQEVEQQEKDYVAEWLEN